MCCVQVLPVPTAQHGIGLARPGVLPIMSATLRTCAASPTGPRHEAALASWPLPDEVLQDVDVRQGYVPGCGNRKSRHGEHAWWRAVVPGYLVTIALRGVWRPLPDIPQGCTPV